MVVGGQHISKAIRMWYDNYQANYWDEERIPDPARYVYAEVLQAETPIQLVRFASGHHQKLQQCARPCTTEDVVRQIGQAMEKKKENDPDNFGLNDQELFVVLESLGVVREADAPKPKQLPKNKTEYDHMVCSS